MLKALSYRAGMRLVNEVELAILRRTAGAHQLVLNPAVMKTRHAVFDHRLLIRRQLIRHADARDSDARIELTEELSLERILPSELGWLAGHFTGRINPQFKNELLIECRVLCPVRCHVLLTCLALQDEVTRGWLIAGPYSPRLAARVRGGVLTEPGFESANRVSGIPHRARAIRRQRR